MRPTAVAVVLFCCPPATYAMVAMVAYACFPTAMGAFELAFELSERERVDAELYERGIGRNPLLAGRPAQHRSQCPTGRACAVTGARTVGSRLVSRPRSPFSFSRSCA